MIDNQLKSCFALSECDISLLGMVLHLRYTGNSGDVIWSSFNHVGLNLYSKKIYISATFKFNFNLNIHVTEMF